MKGRVAFYTLGCKVNQYETEALKERFSGEGFVIAEAGGEPADVYVINTCTVTNLADRKSRQYIRRAVKENPEALVVATGCYVQIRPEEAAEIEGVDLVVGINEKNRIPELVEEALKTRKGGSAAGEESRFLPHVLPYNELHEYRSDGIITAMEGKSRAFIKIEEGCNRFCSYCIIPFARGRVRSRDPEEILTEARTLIDNGFKELVLTGINTALYGTDLGLGGIEPLIGRLNELKGDFRIRLSSLEPTVIDAEYVKGLLKYEKLCHHLHLSLQSGSNRILKAMNRRYTREEFLEIVKVLREFDPFYGVTSDIIVGFPGERDDDFRDSLELVREAGLDRVHPFKYSKRRGTKAAEMPDQIPSDIMQERIRILSGEAEEVSHLRRMEMKGDMRTVLWEEQDSNGLFTGYTDNYVRVYGNGTAGETPIGSFSSVELGEIEGDGVGCIRR